MAKEHENKQHEDPEVEFFGSMLKKRGITLPEKEEEGDGGEKGDKDPEEGKDPEERKDPEEEKNPEEDK